MHQEQAGKLILAFQGILAELESCGLHVAAAHVQHGFDIVTDHLAEQALSYERLESGRSVSDAPED